MLSEGNINFCGMWHQFKMAWQTFGTNKLIVPFRSSRVLIDSEEY